MRCSMRESRCRGRPPSHPERERVAEYLALTSWYGHEEELAEVAARIRAQAGRDAPEQLPLARFSAHTRYLLARRQNRSDGPA